MTIGLASYLTAAGIFLALLLVIVVGRFDDHFKRLLALASAASVVWAASAAYQASFETSLFVPQLLEFLRDLAWLSLLLHLLHTKSSERDKASMNIIIARKGLYGFIVVMIVLAFFVHFSQSVSFFLSGFNYQLAGHLMLAILGLVLIEQILRNTSSDSLRFIKYLCMGIGGMFAYDFYMYSDALLFQKVDLTLWHARGFINAFVVPVIGIALIRNQQWSPGVFISRRIVFHTSALLGTGIYLIAMGIGGYYVRDYGGTWGTVAQTIFLFGAVLLLFMLLFSGSLRAYLRVFINKHFFHYKYDYREEWLRFIRALSTNEWDIPLPERAIRAITQMMNSPSGALWMRQENGSYEPIAVWNMELPESASESEKSSLIRFLEIQKWVINLDEYQRDPGLYQSLGKLEMPVWLKSIPKAWLIAPLILQDSLLGFVVLTRSSSQRLNFNWEDCDLLKTTGCEAASHLAQHAATQALAEARQFEAFNRLSTYIVHDLKNLISQLSLVVSNSAKHRNNPLFMENVISTVGNSVSKMNRLLEHLREGTESDNKKKVNLVTLLEEVVHDAQDVKPSPVFECQEGNISIAVNRDRLASVVGHVVRNAQEATSEGGRVVVRLHTSNGRAVVEVEDSGCGMDESFIRARLFRPFQTTKGSSGMGIGAYEAREFIRSLGGEIHVESHPGSGTIFRIHLPYEAEQEPIKYKSAVK